MYQSQLILDQSKYGRWRQTSWSIHRIRWIWCSGEKVKFTLCGSTWIFKYILSNFPFRCFNNFSKIFQEIFAFVFVWSLITICSELLLIQTQLVKRFVLTIFWHFSAWIACLIVLLTPIQVHHQSDYLAVLLITTIEIIYSFGDLLIICELGQRMNVAFDECKDIFAQIEWYSFSVEIQQMLPMILNFMQQPIEIKCFGSMTCDRETFKYVKLIKLNIEIEFNSIPFLIISHFSDCEEFIHIFHYST